jgi:hypothetical protein
VDRYGGDVLAGDWRTLPRGRSTDLAVEPGLVVEEVQTGWCGAVVGHDRQAVTLEDRHGRRRLFPLGPGFLHEGRPVALVRPRPDAAGRRGPGRTASGSTAVAGVRARVARAGRILVEGVHDAELVERVWGDDLRIEGVVVEPLGGVDDLPAVVRDFRPSTSRRLGVLVDHLVPGSKEQRLAVDVLSGPYGADVCVVGHPYVDVWQAVRPAAVGIAGWPGVPVGVPWKEGVVAALGWDLEPRAAWARILGSVRTIADLEPELSGRVEQLIDFVTAP